MNTEIPLHAQIKKILHKKGPLDRNEIGKILGAHKSEMDQVSKSLNYLKLHREIEKVDETERPAKWRVISHDNNLNIPILPTIPPKYEVIEINPYSPGVDDSPEDIAETVDSRGVYAVTVFGKLDDLEKRLDGKVENAAVKIEVLRRLALILDEEIADVLMAIADDINGGKE